MSSREIVENFTGDVGNYLNEIPELEQFASQVQQLGYTTNIVAFIILFSLTMIFFHCVRIFESGDSLSLGFVSVGTNAPGYQQLPQQFGNNEIGALSQQIQELNNNVSQLNRNITQWRQIQNPIIKQVDIKRKKQDVEVRNVEKEKSEQKEGTICIKINKIE